MILSLIDIGYRYWECKIALVSDWFSQMFLFIKRANERGSAFLSFFLVYLSSLVLVHFFFSCLTNFLCPWVKSFSYFFLTRMSLFNPFTFKVRQSVSWENDRHSCLGFVHFFYTICFSDCIDISRNKWRRFMLTLSHYRRIPIKYQFFFSSYDWRSKHFCLRFFSYSITDSPQGIVLITYYCYIHINRIINVYSHMEIIEWENNNWFTSMYVYWLD